MNKTFLVLLFIILISSFFRLHNLSSVPPSASLDEASIGYNAYSILKTGRDEYGEKFPILLRAYDDWRPALYVYLVIPFVKVFELNSLAVRLPSVILSILSVIATYFLVEELFKKKYIALLSALFLAISPWHIYISRLGHEANLGLSFAIFALLFFVKRKIYLSSIFFAISLISYQTEKVFIPILLVGLFVVYKEDLLKMKKKTVLAVVLGAIILLPFVKATLSPNALIRFKGTNVFEANKPRFINQSWQLNNAVRKNDIIGRIAYNRRLLAGEILAEGYLSHFNPVWLFTNASGDRHKIPDLGLLYIWELPLIIAGVYSLIRYKFNSKTKKIVFLWFLAAPVAASLTTDTPHALRSFVFLPIWQIFSSIGIFSILSFFKSKVIKKWVYAFSFLVIFVSLLYLGQQYFWVFPQKQSASFQYAVSEAIPYVLAKQNSYKNIVFSNNDNLFQSYMFFLFYARYDPKQYLKQGGTVSGGYEVTHKFGKYEFRPVHILDEKIGNLYIGNYQELDAMSIKTIKVISNLDGEKVIKIVTR